MPKTAYSYELRLLLCERCGAPLEVPLGGGATCCAYCGTAAEWVDRELAAPRLATVGGPGTEGERLGRLARQDPLLLPGGTQTGEAIVLPKGEPLLREWQQLRPLIQRGAPPLVQDRFFLLTNGLAAQYAIIERDYARERAVLETARETLRDPRYQQIYTCHLARNAGREGDLNAADAWLSRSDPRFEYLLGDTAYRISVSHVETVRQRWDRVLEVLGPDHRAIPFATYYVAQAFAIRANALEKTGHLDQACQQLAEAFRHGSYGNALPAGIHVLSVCYSNPRLQLCPQSMPKAFEQVHGRRYDDAVHYDPATGMLTIRSSLRARLLMVAVLMILVALVVWALVV